MTVSKHPASNVAEPLVENDQLGVGVDISHARRIHHDGLVPTLGRHVVRKSLPDNDPLALAVLKHVPALLHPAGRAVFVLRDAKQLWVDRDGGQAGLIGQWAALLLILLLLLLL